MDRVVPIFQDQQSNETNFCDFFNINHVVMLLIDPENGSIVDANPAACKFYGWDRDVLIKKKISEINTLTTEEISSEMQRAMAEERNHFIFIHSLADGSKRDVEVFTGPIKIKGKKLLYSIIHDITDRKKAEASLRLNENRFGSMVEKSPVAIGVFSLEGITLCQGQVEMS